MKKRVKHIFILSMLASVLLYSCSSKEKEVPLDSEELLSFDVSTLDDREYDVNLSELMESVEIIQLDNSTEEAFTKIWKVEISENYIMTIMANTPVKLFDRSNGKFIGNIGKIGQGPGEYNLISEGTIDEEKNRIYLTEAFKNHAYAYDMEGNFIKDETLYFPERIMWNEVYINKDNILVFMLPFLAHKTNPLYKEADKNVCWTQDRKGNIIQSIPAGKYAMNLSPCSQIYTSHLYKDSPVYSFSIRDVNMTRADTIYHYNIRENTMYPVYTTNLPYNKLCLVSSAESPSHYYTTQTKYKDGTEVNPWFIEYYRMLQVDKKTKKARYVRIKNDMLGGIDVPVISFLLQMKDDTLWLHYYDLPALKDQLEEALETNKDMSEEVRKRITGMKNRLNENDNDILVICKFKKEI